MTKQIRELQEMLAFVLATIGKPVVVPKELIRNGIPQGIQIQIIEDHLRDAFVFQLGKEDNEPTENTGNQDS